MRCEDLVVKLVVRQVQAASLFARGQSQYFGQCLKLGKGPTRSVKVEREQYV